jgi:FlaA1/EpsC-like NDP-sugar epimerase
MAVGPDPSRHVETRDSSERSFWQLARGYAPIFMHDVLVGVASFLIALVLRLGPAEAQSVMAGNLWLGLLYGVILGVATLFMGLSRTIWRYASMADAIRLVGSAMLAVLVWVAIAFISIRLTDVPRTVPFIMLMATVLGLIVPRMTYRYYRENRHSLPMSGRSRTAPHRVVVIGTDNAAMGFVSAARQDGSRFDVAAIVDWSGQKAGRRVHGCSVFSFTADLDTLFDSAVASNRPIGFLLVYPPPEGLTQASLDRLIDIATRRRIPIRRVHELSAMNLSADQRLQTPDILQLLGRKERLAEEDGEGSFFKDKRILVTGAGGSIGSELCRQIALRGPAGIATLENSEFNLVVIGRQLADLAPNLAVTPILCDVRDTDRLRRAVSLFAPDVIYHAAALKHVPVTEAFAEETVLTNIGGTIGIADIARSLNVPLLVNISTDKAVNPVNVLGLTKRAGEIYLQGLDRLRARGDNGQTRYVSVRFGNVIDSSGSVVPLFREQIARGGPVTVTDPEIERFCMSVSEAVSLVLSSHEVVDEMQDQLGGLIVLDMGRSVKIDKLARQMIRLAGQEPDRDIPITYVGLRPGEKMHEELFHEHENRVQTKSNRLFYVQTPEFDFTSFADGVRRLLHDLPRMSEEDIRAALGRLEQNARLRKVPHIQLVQ